MVKSLKFKKIGTYAKNALVIMALVGVIGTVAFLGVDACNSTNANKPNISYIVNNNGNEITVKIREPYTPKTKIFKGNYEGYVHITYNDVVYKFLYNAPEVQEIISDLNTTFSKLESIAQESNNN